VYQELLDPNLRLFEHIRHRGSDEMEAQPMERGIQRLKARLACWKGRCGYPPRCTACDQIRVGVLADGLGLQRLGWGLG
jgi:hypothetical protein